VNPWLAAHWLRRLTDAIARWTCRRPHRVSLSGVFVDLHAFHTDPIMGEGRHAHVWRVTAYYPARPWRDKRSPKAALTEVLGVWQGQDLPTDLWADEALAGAVARLMANCVGVRVERAEGFVAEVWL
jgi:hypothetical protein